jgi:hypothetical protein
VFGGGVKELQAAFLGYACDEMYSLQDIGGGILTVL